MEKTVKNSLALTYEGKAEFTVASIWLYGESACESLVDVVCRALGAEESTDPVSMRCRIQLTIDRLPDDDLKVEVK